METIEKKYSKVTNELLERTGYLKNSIKSSFIKGDKNILEGIEIFETILKEINPDIIDDDMQVCIENTINLLMTDINDITQTINPDINYGIKCCYMILEGYNKASLRRLKKH